MSCISTWPWKGRRNCAGNSPRWDLILFDNFNSFIPRKWRTRNSLMKQSSPCFTCKWVQSRANQCNQTNASNAVVAHGKVIVRDNFTSYLYSLVAKNWELTGPTLSISRYLCKLTSSVWQDYVHTSEERYNTVCQMVTEAGLHLMSVCEAKLEEEEPRTLLKDTGFEDQCAKLNNHPAKYITSRQHHVLFIFPQKPYPSLLPY